MEMVELMLLLSCFKGIYFLGIVLLLPGLLSVNVKVLIFWVSLILDSLPIMAYRECFLQFESATSGDKLCNCKFGWSP